MFSFVIFVCLSGPRPDRNLPPGQGTWRAQKIVKEISGDFTLKVHHTPGIRNFDVAVRFNGFKAEKLKGLNRGEVVNYTGELVGFDPETGYYLEDGDIE